MRQISLRQEAGRLGGIGVCGRELCCSTWLSDFKNVATSAARYQNLSLNPSKLSGQCGRLKCCLNYELETYVEALKFIPEVEAPLLTEKGEARLQKTDIFRKIMWFAYKEENNWYALNVDRVNEILALNREGKKPASLELDQEEVKIPIATLNSDLESLDKKFQNKGRNKNRNKNRRGGDNRGNQNPNQKNPNDQNRNQNQNQKNPNDQNQNRKNQNPNNPNQGNQNRGNQNRPNPNRGK